MQKKVSKKRQKDDYVEQLEKEVRELKSIVRSLQKKLKRVDKGFKIEHESKEDTRTIPNKIYCPECSKDELKTIDIAGRKFERCETCGYRNRARKM